ncbi:sensor histidine kinase, partial [Methylobacterium sp. E-025]|uniref:sensor histidine kinase n=1 Tax=Methylobacterium sp. E-025 TaxID=2836561 RepID=UPI00391DB442
MSADKVADLVQLDRRTTTNGTAGKRGSGLGLQLCRNLVERQGRTLTVEGVPSRGTTFGFILPRPRWSGGSAPHCSGPEPAWRPDGEVARRLGAAVQHHHEGHGPPVVNGRDVKAVGPAPGEVPEPTLKRRWCSQWGDPRNYSHQDTLLEESRRRRRGATKQSADDPSGSSMAAFTA